MYLIFSKFQGWISAGGGSFGPKTGTNVGWGDWQNFCQMGDPSVPPGKKNPVAYLNFDSIFEFLGQFTITCIYYFLKKGVDNFEIRAQNMFIFG